MGSIRSYSYIPDSTANRTSPLVSVVLATYNQEDLSLIAFESLLSQDYDNLEIIAVDDCSSDNTYEVLEARCRQYRGPHIVRIIKNEVNLGICKNYEYGFRLAKGELIVTGGGDDISYPNRVSVIVEKWLRTNRKATVIFHKLRPIDMDGVPLGYEWWKLTLRNPIGAAMAYSRVVVDVFPEVSVKDCFEDNVFARRAYLFGEQLHIEDTLIDYRVGSGMTSSGDDISKREKISRYMVNSSIQNAIDVDYVREVAIPCHVRDIELLHQEIAKTYVLENEMITGASCLKRIRAFGQYRTLTNRLHPITPYWMLRHYLPMMFPKEKWFFQRVLFFRHRVREYVNKMQSKWAI